MLDIIDLWRHLSDGIGDAVLWIVSHGLIIWAIRVGVWFSLWRISLKLRRIIENNDRAFTQLLELRQMRLDSIRVIEDHFAHEQQRADAFDERLRTHQAAVAKQLAITAADAAKQVTETLGTIQSELLENTALTREVGEKSVHALGVANHMNEKLIKTHDTVIQQLDALTRPAQDSLQRIDAHTAATERHTAKIAAELKDFKDDTTGTI